MWETIDQTRNTDRAVVPGGWLYRTFFGGSIAMCFVPYPPLQPVYPAIGLSESYTREEIEARR